MFARLCSERLTSLAQEFPAAFTLGVRQDRKTVLARQTFDNFTYLDLEDLATRGLFALAYR